MARSKDVSSLRPQTRLVRGGTLRSAFDETSEAIYMTSGYVYESAEEAEAAFKGDKARFVYSRYANPTVSMLEERLCLMEGAEACRVTSSGMAAVFAALMSQLKAGDRIVSSRALFGSCLYIVNDILPRFGVRSELVDGTDMQQWEQALAEPADVVFLETPSNPNLDIIDLQRVCDLAHAAGARVVVDNVFATPILQKPMTFGADIVVYSATKHIDGQGRCLGGAVLCSEEFCADYLVNFLRHTGPSLSPFNAWVMLKGLETLDLRVRRHCENADRIARKIESERPDVKVIYPGLGSHPQHELAMAQMSGSGGPMIALDLPGGRKQAFQFLNSLSLADISNNLGDAKTLATHPATTTHQRLTDDERERLGITPGMVRISIGLEDADDLLDDFLSALG
ncbi:O-succinylhomoserine sulfhydrylase [Fodinicurvata sp. EGI_FJ10296]|uniref:O-succinylhomoserine sulfhydrylase n=1 Tax=Fodinicurvata sp. EGI_FJ10296 TaxID=3231908 RepID=UPI0034566C9F